MNQSHVDLIAFILKPVQFDCTERPLICWLCLKLHYCVYRSALKFIASDAG